MRKEQSGRSMVEMIGVLAIIGVLAVGIYALYNVAVTRLKINQTTDLVQKMINDIRTAHSVRDEYYGVANSKTDVMKYFVDKNIISSSLCVDPKKCDGSDTQPLLHPLMGRIIISTSKTDRTLSIQLNSLNRKSCTYITTSDWGTGGSTSNVVQTLIINGTTEYIDFPISVFDANAACIGKDNTIEFVLRPLRNKK